MRALNVRQAEDVTVMAEGKIKLKIELNRDILR